MGKVKLSMSMSLDGYVAGPGQDEDNPLGVGGMALHQWHLGPDASDPVNKQVAEEILADNGATIMGRNMFGPVRGEWGDPDWRGWWGDEPPYRCPTFVLTHHAREPVEMEGGTTFHFVTDGLEAALEQAHKLADGRDVSVAGGASTLQQCIAGGHLDQLLVNQVPVLLGAGERLFDHLDAAAASFELAEVVTGPDALHLTYRITAQP
jgi:dihydrofolate reductase